MEHGPLLQNNATLLTSRHAVKAVCSVGLLEGTKQMFPKPVRGVFVGFWLSEFL